MELETAWFNVLAPLIDATSPIELAERGEIPKPGDGTVYSCPTVKLESLVTEHGNPWNPDTPWIAYGMNRFIDGHSGRAGDFVYSELLAMDEVPEPSAFAFLGEVKSRYANVDARRLADRHNGKKRTTNILFADSHVANFRGKDVIPQDGEGDGAGGYFGGIIWDPSLDYEEE